MATAESLTQYCKQFKRFKGVFSFDKIDHIFNQNINNGEFFIYNSDSSRKDGTHWRMMMRINHDCVFCFDSFGRKNFLTQVPNTIQHNTQLLEYAYETTLKSNLNQMSINYNDYDYTAGIRNLKLKDSQEKWFLNFCREFTKTNNSIQMGLIFNTKCYQIESSSLCGAWICYFLHLLFNENDTQFWEIISTDTINSILDVYFHDTQEHFENNVARAHVKPLHDFIKSDLWIYLNDVAKNLFSKDFDVFYLKDLQDNQMVEFYQQKEEIHYPNYDVHAKAIEKNNAILDYLTSLDLLRVKYSSDSMVTNEELQIIPDVLLSNDVERLKYDDKMRYYNRKYKELRNINQFQNIPLSERNESKEIQRLINNYEL